MNENKKYNREKYKGLPCGFIRRSFNPSLYVEAVLERQKWPCYDLHKTVTYSYQNERGKNMERYTYEITFTRLDGQPDEIQQHTSEELARECFRLFDEPDSAEMYSKIQLTRHDWKTGADEILETMTF